MIQNQCSSNVITVAHSNIDDEFTHCNTLYNSLVQTENVEGECKKFKTYK